MSPSAIPIHAGSGSLGETVAAVADGSAAALSSKQQQYASGDPHLAAMDEEVEQAPRFDDPYEERRYLKHRLAIAFRIFAQLDLAESIAGHITLRDPVDPSSFWVNPFGSLILLLKSRAKGNQQQMLEPLFQHPTYRHNRYALLADPR